MPIALNAIVAFVAPTAVSVCVGRRNYAMSDRDSLYIACKNEDIGFSSDDASQPALSYIDGLSAGDLR